MIKHLEPHHFDKLLSSKEKALVMFYADWCPFCQEFKPIFEAVAAKSNNLQRSRPEYNNNKMYGAKMNDDDNPLWDRFSINAVPTIIAFDKGKIVSRRDAKMGIGLNKSDLDSILKELR
jgi:thiol-disulfide isomerase/thioredoxin